MKCRADRKAFFVFLDIMNTYKSSLPLLLLFLLIGAVSLSAQHNKAPIDTIQFIQGDNVHPLLKENDTITLDRDEFHIRYHAKKFDPNKKKPYSLRVAVMDHPDNKIHAGTNVETVDYFRMGTGMANDDVNLLIIADGGNNYIFYQDENERRADLLSQKGEDLLLDIDVRKLYVPISNLDSKAVELKDTHMKELWFVIWYDADLNNKIDKGELKKVHLRFR